ncbi:MAG: hypothetical protein ACNYZG_11725 [Gammaproteobacteria bacterium]
MNSKITDVIIHTKEQLSEQQFAEVTDQVYKTDGIVSLSRNVHTPKFLMIVYNASRTRANGILTTVKALGYDASLVGI